MNSKKTYISLFSSGGIGCYGFKLNGFECIATNELLESRLNIQKVNNKCKYETGYIGGDITSEETHKRLFDEIEMWKEKEGVEQVDVVIATPPCQGMSIVNLKKTNDEQIRNSLIVQAIKLISQIQPKVFIFENVRAFMKTICTDTDGVNKPIKDSIYSNLSDRYNIYHRVINFKDYGVPSSRPRTIVIGTSKECTNLSPLTLFPSKHKEIKLIDAIGDLRHLEYGEKDKNDFFHFARPFPIEQLDWIKYLKEGQSAFKQPIEFQPGYYDKDGNKIVNKCSNIGNKYCRLSWNKVCSCIHTRNDTLSSQDTIHPSDNRVLSIRELMRVMSIPDTFHWTNEDDKITSETQDKYLKSNELNIRRCIGEAVPTQIMRNISDKIKFSLDNELGNQIDFFNKIKDIEIKNNDVKIKVIDINCLLKNIQQIINLFSNKNKLDLYCINCSKEEQQHLSELIKIWDLTEFAQIHYLTNEELLNESFQFILINSNLECCGNI